MDPAPVQLSGWETITIKEEPYEPAPHQDAGGFILFDAKAELENPPDLGLASQQASVLVKSELEDSPGLETWQQQASACKVKLESIASTELPSCSLDSPKGSQEQDSCNSSVRGSFQSEDFTFEFSSTLCNNKLDANKSIPISFTQQIVLGEWIEIKPEIHFDTEYTSNETLMDDILEHSVEENAIKSKCENLMDDVIEHSVEEKAPKSKTNSVKKTKKKKKIVGSELNKDSRYLCSHCELYFSKHTLTKHQVQVNYCRFCKKYFKSEKAARKHLHDHPKKYKSNSTNKHRCDMCSQYFLTSEIRSEHVNCFNCIDRQCRYCQQLLESRQHYERHMMDCHSSATQCPFCNMRAIKFKPRKHYHQHTLLRLQVHHCEHCKTRFGVKPKYLRHICPMAKDISCELCNFEFINFIEFDEHVKVCRLMVGSNSKTSTKRHNKWW